MILLGACIVTGTLALLTGVVIGHMTGLTCGWQIRGECDYLVAPALDSKVHIDSWVDRWWINRFTR